MAFSTDVVERDTANNSSTTSANPEGFLENIFDWLDQNTSPSSSRFELVTGIDEDQDAYAFTPQAASEDFHVNMRHIEAQNVSQNANNTSVMDPTGNLTNSGTTRVGIGLIDAAGSISDAGEHGTSSNGGTAPTVDSITPSDSGEYLCLENNTSVTMDTKFYICETDDAIWTLHMDSTQDITPVTWFAGRFHWPLFRGLTAGLGLAWIANEGASDRCFANHRIQFASDQWGETGAAGRNLVDQLEDNFCDGETSRYSMPVPMICYDNDNNFDSNRVGGLSKYTLFMPSSKEAQAGERVDSGGEPFIYIDNDVSDQGATSVHTNQIMSWDDLANAPLFA